MPTVAPHEVPAPSLLVRRRRYEGRIHLVRENYLVLLDEVPDFVWLSLDGRTTVDEVAKRMADNYGCKYEDALTATAEIIASFAEQSLVTFARAAGEARDGNRTPTAADWVRLSSSPDRRKIFAIDLYFRECWADAVDALGARAADVLASLALINVKPDAVVGRRTRAVLDFVVEHGFRPVTAAPFRLNRHSMRELWRYDWDVYPVDRLTFSSLWYTSADLLAFVVQDAGAHGAGPASARLAALKGSAVPEKRRPTDLRSVLRPPNRVLNFVHVADEPADVVRELGIFFDRDERRALFREIAANLGASRIDAARESIDALEARFPSHDLAFVPSLERLLGAGVLTRETATELMALFERGAVLGWDALNAFATPPLDVAARWDFIAVMSHLIPLERPT